MSDDTFHYLAYGSNLHPLRLSERVGSVECLGRVCLSGWRLCFDKRGSDGSAKANLRAAPDSDRQAWGAIFRLQRQQYATLDRFEGCGRGYETFWLDLTIDGKLASVLTYLTPSHWQTGAARPYDWYRQLIVIGAQYHGFPANAIDTIAATPAIPDPDIDRARRQASLIARLERHREKAS